MPNPATGWNLPGSLGTILVVIALILTIVFAALGKFQPELAAVLLLIELGVLIP